jgi:hypothetical protein
MKAEAKANEASDEKARRESADKLNDGRQLGVPNGETTERVWR